MASSSSVSCGSLYDVFLSFRGEDVRKGFLSHVVEKFKSKGISPFIDNEMERGKSVGPTLIGAIRQSKVAIVLLSPNYASSSWCLDELVEIMKCREEDKQRVITVFYEVDPSDVRKQTGDFGKAFDETCVGKTEEVTLEWREALKEVAGIAGYASSNCGSEADLINDLATNIMGVLPLTPSNDFDDFVGIEDRVTEMKKMLSLQTKDVKVIGIWGPAGIGKTTAARVLYNQVSPGFSFSTFLENIKGSFERPCGNDHQLKLRFQEKLLSQIFNQKDIVVGHLRTAPERLCDKKALVVLDEVDSWWQLEEMAKRAWFGPGSMVIITTEDGKLFKTLGLEANQIYEMKLPTGGQALQIFCLYAFGQKFPNYHFETLAWEVAMLAGNLPLGLRVMGSYLRGMSENEWKDALPSLRSSLHGEIESTLKLSYSVLSDAEKALFLHIACFFVGFRVDWVKSILEKTDLNVNHGLQTLAYRSLIYIEFGRVRMHSLLQQMGEDIVYGQSAEPGKRQFLTKTSEISDFFDENTPLPCLKVMDLSKSPYLKRIPDLSKATSLEILDLHKCRSLLELTSSIGNATKLRFCMFRKCERLKELPSSIGRLINLEKLNLSYCWSLEKLNGNCLNFEKLRGCSSLKELDLSHSGIALELPSSISTWSCLYRLDMTGSSDLKKFPNVPYSIVELVLDNTGIEEIPPWIENLYCLQHLSMNECRNLEIVSPNISKLENLENISLFRGDISGPGNKSYGGEYFEADINWGPDLERRWIFQSDLNVHYILPTCLPEKVLTSPKSLCSFRGDSKTFPDCIRRLSGLSELNITYNRKLTALPQIPGSLLSLDATECECLESIDSSFQNPNICLNFAGCYKLNQKARKLIQTSACKYAFLPGRKVPAHFTHRAISDSLTINLTPKPLPSSFRFKACILLSDRFEPKKVSCGVRGKLNGRHTVPYGSNQLHYLPRALGSCRDHLYIFEDSFSLNQDCPEAKDATFSELSFRFTLDDDKASKVKGCGVRILEVLDGKETEYQDINIEANNENADDDDDEGDEVGDDSESADDDDDFEEDVDDNDPDINIEANNETEEGKELGRGGGEEKWSRKRLR